MSTWDALTWPDGMLPAGRAMPGELEQLRLVALEERLAHARHALAAAARIEAPRRHRREVLALAALAGELHLTVLEEIGRG